MNILTSRVPRRQFLGEVIAFGAAAYYTPGVFAQELVRTPDQTEGPFYPNRLPLDTDNDLIIINNAATPALGQITHFSGRVRDARGNPVGNSLVEIWQVDNNAAYLHSDSANHANRDGNFQGFGRFLTGMNGEFYFRTIKPVPYPGRTPHIHVAVKIRGREPFNTQCYIRGEPRNANDGVLQSVRDPRARESLIVDFAPVANSRINELAARFEIVLGFTPAG
jgi:protocatechuate 3,4-dioxygenase beta subunit